MSPSFRIAAIGCCALASTGAAAGVGHDVSPPWPCSPAPDRAGWAYTDSLDTSHFRVRWLNDPSDPNHSTPAYATSVAAELERVWTIYRHDWGLPQPRGWLEAGSAGVPLIAVGIHAIGYAGGYASVGAPFPGDCPFSREGGLGIQSSMETTLLRTVVAHEVFHAFQYAIDRQSAWYGESTARWVEWQVVPEFRRATDIHRIVRFPYTTLWEDVPYSRTYGGVIFWQFLEDRFGEPFALQVVRATCDDTWIDSLDRILREDHGSSLDEALVEFWQWNYHTGPADDGLHYSGESTFPRIAFQAVHAMDTPVSATLPDSLVAQPAACNAIVFEGRAHRENLRIRFDGAPELAAHRTLSVITTTEPRTHRIVASASPDASGDYEVIVEGWDAVDSVCLLVTNHRGAELYPALLGYRYEAEEKGAEVFDVGWELSRGELSALQLASAPNPFREAVQIRYESVGGPTSVSILDVRGRELRRLVSGTSAAGHFNVNWDGRNDRGRSVGTGVYFIHLRTGERRRTHRVALLR